ncbi:MAG TPA: hypothetical protein VFB33_12775 [Candidatus Binataceae bacterium]|jgi:hypothetical protein|nr:hypothetical protein [Candidatus Binataceae bacterium]
MQTELNREPNTSERPGIVYRTVCQNPGCGSTFDLRITPDNASLLSGTIACPRCRRHGGMLKPQGRLGNKLFAAKLVFRTANVAYSRADEEEAAAETEARY